MQEKAGKNKTVVCRCCNKVYSKANMIQILPHFYVHKNHLEEFKKTYDYKFAMLMNDFYILSNKEFDYIVMMRQLKNYIKNYGFTLEGIKYSLDYYLSIHGWNSQYGLNQFLPTYYDKAKEYYQHLKLSKHSLIEKEEDEVKDFRKPNQQSERHIINTEF